MHVRRQTAKGSVVSPLGQPLVQLMLPAAHTLAADAPSKVTVGVSGLKTLVVSTKMFYPRAWGSAALQVPAKWETWATHTGRPNPKCPCQGLQLMGPPRRKPCHSMTMHTSRNMLPCVPKKRATGDSSRPTHAAVSCQASSGRLWSRARAHTAAPWRRASSLRSTWMCVGAEAQTWVHTARTCLRPCRCIRSLGPSEQHEAHGT